MNKKQASKQLFAVLSKIAGSVSPRLAASPMAAAKPKSYLQRLAAAGMGMSAPGPTLMKFIRTAKPGVKPLAVAKPAAKPVGRVSSTGVPLGPTPPAIRHAMNPGSGVTQSDIDRFYANMGPRPAKR